MWKSGTLGVFSLALVFGACSSKNGADNSGDGAGTSIGGVGASGANGGNGASTSSLGGVGQQNLGGGANGASTGGSSQNNNAGGSGGTGGVTSTNLRPTCATCDATCCASDDCGVVGFVGCPNTVDCGFGACAQSLCGTGTTTTPGQPQCREQLNAHLRPSRIARPPATIATQSPMVAARLLLAALARGRILAVAAERHLCAATPTALPLTAEQAA